MARDVNVALSHAGPSALHNQYELWKDTPTDTIESLSFLTITAASDHEIAKDATLGGLDA
jgi:hypothetical protein